MPSKTCLLCGKPLVLKSRRDLERKKFCSHVCRGTHLGRQRDMAPLWAKANLPEVNARKGSVPKNKAPVGARASTPHGYVKVKIDETRWEYEHRIIAGTPPDMDTHHKNGDKSDNRPENLAVLTHAEHRRLHRMEELGR